MVSTCSHRNVEWFNLYIYIFFGNYISQDSELMAKTALINRITFYSEMYNAR